MSNSIFMLSKYLKKSVATALILGLMLAPGLSAAQGISSSINIAAQAAEVEIQAEETQAAATQAATENWLNHYSTSWYNDAGNDGVERPYEIETAKDLAGLAYLVNVEGVSFADRIITVTVDSIDLGAYEWVPIGTKDSPFQGTFDGQDCIIDNMQLDIIQSKECIGLFGNIESATIKNVEINDGFVNCVRDDNKAGGICGSAKNSTISYCTYSGFIDAIIDECEDVIIGGICGKIEGTSIINNCTSVADINIDHSNNDQLPKVGGICGKASGTSTVKDCASNVNITATGDSSILGGICGLAGNGSTISGCICDGTIESVLSQDRHAYIGGICGQANKSSTISRCVNIGSITANNGDNSRLGGICGLANKNSTISRCINVGNVIAKNDDNSKLGGICGEAKQNSTVENDYYMHETAPLGIGNTTTDLLVQEFTKEQIEDGSITDTLNNLVSDYN